MSLEFWDPLEPREVASWGLHDALHMAAVFITPAAEPGANMRHVPLFWHFVLCSPLDTKRELEITNGGVVLSCFANELVGSGLEEEERRTQETGLVLRLSWYCVCLWSHFFGLSSFFSFWWGVFLGVSLWFLSPCAYFSFDFEVCTEQKLWLKFFSSFFRCLSKSWMAVPNSILIDCSLLMIFFLLTSIIFAVF